MTLPSAMTHVEMAIATTRHTCRSLEPRVACDATPNGHGRRTGTGRMVGWMIEQDRIEGHWWSPDAGDSLDRAMRRIAGVAALVLLLGSCNVQPSAGAAPLSTDERAAIELASTLEKRLKSLRARTALSTSQRAELDTRLAEVRAALAEVGRVRERGTSQSVVLGKIGLLAGGLLADDTTGAGVADDGLLLPCAIAALLAIIVLDAPADGHDLADAWNQLGTALSALETSITDVTATTAACPKLAADEIPPRDQCTAHHSECLMTPLGNRNSGGIHGHTICRDCLAACQGQGEWPESNSKGADCRWWRY